MFSICLGTRKVLPGWLHWVAAWCPCAAATAEASSAKAHQRLKLVFSILYVLFRMCHLGDGVTVARYVLARMLHGFQNLRSLHFQRSSQAWSWDDSSYALIRVHSRHAKPLLALNTNKLHLIETVKDILHMCMGVVCTCWRPEKLCSCACRSCTCRSCLRSSLAWSLSSCLSLLCWLSS